MAVNIFKTLDAISSLTQLRKFDLAQAKAMELLEAYPDQAMIHLSLAIVLYHKGDLEDAKCILEKVIGMDPNISKAYNLLGGYYLKKDLLNEAEENYKQALAIHPNVASYHGNLGLVYFAMKAYEATIQCAEMGLEHDPESEHCLHVLYKAYLAKGQTSKAEATLRLLLKKNPENTDSLIDLGYEQYNKEKYGQAGQTFRSVIALGGNHKSALRGIKTAIVGDHPINKYLTSLVSNHNLGRGIKVIVLLGFLSGMASLTGYSPPVRIHEIFLIALYHTLVLQIVPMSLSTSWVFIFYKAHRSLFTKVELFNALLSTLFYLSFLSILVALHIYWFANAPHERIWVLIAVYSLILAVMFSFRASFDLNAKVHYAWVTMIIMVALMASSLTVEGEDKWGYLVFIFIVGVLDIRFLLYLLD